MKSAIVGRKAELGLLKEIVHSEKAEFVAVYGRRRIGKTYLIREFFAQQDCLFFQVSGIQKAKTSEQLVEFKKEIQNTFYRTLKRTQLETPRSWLSAFEMLSEAITLFGKDRTVVLFFDEFPWMAMRKDKLLQGLDYYWNRYWSTQSNIKLIICGSAASWIIENVLNSKGGLHNRVTQRIPLAPLTLPETQDYLKHRGIQYDHYAVLQLYLCIGGVPYYLDMLKKGLSVAQNINQLCFQRKGTLLDEFHNLFAALFKQGALHESMIRMIAVKREGASREEIESALGMKGGTLTLRLKELQQTGFITAFTPLGRKYGTYYKITDEYTLFYLSWIEPILTSGLPTDTHANYWEEVHQTPAWKAWAGYTFETICYKHLNAIRKALCIPNGATTATARYKGKNNQPGTQIDLVFDRSDGIVNLCEIKHSNSVFNIDKEYAAILQKKCAVYRAMTKTHKQVVISMITTFGLKASDYAQDEVFSSCTLDDLFKGTSKNSNEG